MKKKSVYLLGATPNYSICLALKYLEACIQADATLCSHYEAQSRTIYLNEWNISNFFLASNPSILTSDMVQDIVSKKPDIVGYSLYPWNVGLFNAVSKQVKVLLPEVVQVVGGPSVSGFGERILLDNAAIDFAFEGEAERSFSEFLLRRIDSQRFDHIPGLYRRENRAIAYTSPNHGHTILDDIPSPWPNYRREKNEYIYYEASRGCIWKCKYCAFSRNRRFQHYSMDRIRRDFDCIMQLSPQSIYFIDADICGNEAFAAELLEYLLDCTGETEFGFEFNALTAGPRVIDLLGELFRRKKLLELEIGVQTTTPRASRLVGRRLDLKMLTRNLEFLRKKAPLLPFKFNLIFGLPGEAEEQFYKGVDFLWRFQPCRIVAYPLCLLPGTRLYAEAAGLGILFDDHPPFQVLATEDLSLESMIRIRKFSTLLAVAFYKNHELLETVASSMKGSLSETILSFLDSRDIPACEYEKASRRLLQEITGFLTRRARQE